MTAGVTWSEVLTTLLAGRELDAGRVRAAVETILVGEATSAQIAGFLIALRAKGETPGELVAMLGAVRAAGVPVELEPSLASRAIDVVGTGGDGTSSVNVSTMASLVIAGAGVPVCKHGNRASSSTCGSADVLEALGVTLDLVPQAVARCVAEAGLGFCFAPRFHPAFRFAGPTRRELGVPTAFNLLGPLANPAGVTRLLVGAASPDVAALLAQVLAASGTRRAWVVHGPDGLDELSTGGINLVWDVNHGSVTEHQLRGDDLGLQVASVEALRGGDAQHNAEIARQVLAGTPGPVRDVVVLNAAAGLVVADAAADLAEGIAMAQLALDNGSAAQVLERVVALGTEQAAEQAAEQVAEQPG
jgi:anthranilate phosphoribosyltransferase